MPGRNLKEEALQLGEGGRLFTIVCEPQERLAGRPVFVFLSAGLLHRVGPSRLHVTLARDLADRGFPSLRVDLSGKGDSPARGSMKNRESVALDFDDIRSGLRARYGEVSMILAGLCSGADNAIRLSAMEPGVKGLLLLDPICFPDAGFRRRALAAKWLSPRRYAKSVMRMLRGDAPGERHGLSPDDDPLMLRDLPSREDMRQSFGMVRDRGGNVLSIFTQYALGYYNSAGQLGAVLQVSDYPAFCSETFWPDVEHTYKLAVHRERLREHVLAWAHRFA